MGTHGFYRPIWQKNTSGKGAGEKPVQMAHHRLGRKERLLCCVMTSVTMHPCLPRTNYCVSTFTCTRSFLDNKLYGPLRMAWKK